MVGFPAAVLQPLNTGGPVLVPTLPATMGDAYHSWRNDRWREECDSDELERKASAARGLCLVTSWLEGGYDGDRDGAQQLGQWPPII